MFPCVLLANLSKIKCVCSSPAFVPVVETTVIPKRIISVFASNPFSRCVGDTARIKGPHNFRVNAEWDACP